MSMSYFLARHLMFELQSINDNNWWWFHVVDLSVRNKVKGPQRSSEGHVNFLISAFLIILISAKAFLLTSKLVWQHAKYTYGWGENGFQEKSGKTD